MIFATVGSSSKPFDRMVAAVDNLASRVAEGIIIQKGVSRYEPKIAKYFDFCDSEKMASLIKEANVVISHAGFGMIADCIRFHKPLILIPREHRFGDAEGNQVELAEYLAENTRGIICIRDVKQLLNAFNQIKNTIPNYQFSSRIPELVQNFIDRRLA